MGRFVHVDVARVGEGPSPGVLEGCRLSTKGLSRVGSIAAP